MCQMTEEGLWEEVRHHFGQESGDILQTIGRVLKELQEHKHTKVIPSVMLVFQYRPSISLNLYS